MCCVIYFDMNILFASVPWNQETFEGWCLLVLYSMITGFCFLVVNYSFLTFFLSIGEFYFAFANFFHDAIEHMDEKFRENPNDVTTVKLQLCELIQFHISVKE